MTCLEILSVQEPFYGKDDLTVFHQLSHEKHPDRPRNMQIGFYNEIWDVMLQCWGKNPEDRPGMLNITTFLGKFRIVEPFPGNMSLSCY